MVEIIEAGFLAPIEVRFAAPVVVAEVQVKVP